MDFQPATKTPLLDVRNDSETWFNTISSICLYMSLPFVMILSSIGMLLIKTGESSDTLIILLSGLTLEGLAFAIYPLSMRAYSLKTITVCWAGASTLTSTVGGYIFFNENPSIGSLVGCVLILFGIVVISFG